MRSIDLRAAVLGLLAAACGGGGGGSNPCADLAASVNACYEEAGDDPDPYVQRMCEAYVCTGDKQAGIDEVVAASCEDKEALSQSLPVALGCTFKPTCEGVAFQVATCFEEDPDVVLDDCNTTTCDTAAGKLAAMQCLVALSCEDDIEDFSACMVENGCPDPFSR